MFVKSSDTAMRRPVVTLKGRTAIHMDVDSLEERANRNLLKFNIYDQEQKCEIQLLSLSSQSLLDPLYLSTQDVDKFKHL